MKKFYLSLFFVLLVQLPVLAFAQSGTSDYLGLNHAKLNINVRSQPMMGENLISHFNKGDEVMVTKVIKSWCRVNYKNSQNAYVYCPNLQRVDASTSADLIVEQQGGISTPVASPAPTSSGYSARQAGREALVNVYSWLVDNNKGVDFINGCVYNAVDQATSWQSDASFVDFSLQFPTAENPYCGVVFSSNQAKTKFFKVSSYYLEKPSSASSVYSVNSLLTQYAYPKLLLKNFVAGMLEDHYLQAELAGRFKNSANVTVNFRLYKLNNSIKVWEARFLDPNTGALIVANSDAYNPEPHINFTL